jgi:hypothetical protein
MQTPPRIVADLRLTLTIPGIIRSIEALDAYRRDLDRRATAAPSAPPLRVPAERRRVARVEREEGRG